MSESFGFEGAYDLAINRNGEFVAFDRGVDLMPLPGFKLVRKCSVFLGYERFLMLSDGPFFPRVTEFEVHFTGFLVGDFYVIRADGDLEKVPSPNGFQVHIGEVES